MLTYRTFHNTDPPVLTDLWRSRHGQSGLAESVSPDLFEQFVYAKLYFDYDGLIIARDGDRPVGFAHAAFGPNEAEDAISTELGVVCLVLVRPDCEEAEVAAGLVRQCETYLQGHGAKVIYGGGIPPLNGFYLGLYGGSELPGVLDSDPIARAAFDALGYREIDRTMILHRDLEGFQAPMDRQQMQIRRRMFVEVTDDPRTRTWWEACTVGGFELTRFELISRQAKTVLARAVFRSMEPAGAFGQSGPSAGLIALSVEESARRRGLAVFLLSEAFRHLNRQGIAAIEAQAMQHNLAALAMYEKLGFRQVGQGGVFRKEK